MSHLKNYHRPAELPEALRLLARSEVKTVPLAGGTFLNAHLDESVEEAVDLQGLNLDRVEHGPGTLTVGAMTRLQTIVDHAQAPPLLREMARREGPNTFRHAATLGGVIAGADMESELLAALLVFEAQVTIESVGGTKTVPLASLPADVPTALNGGLITAITLQTTGQTAAERVARTPADKPIVAVVGRKDPAGKIHLALCGVAPTPALADPTNPTANLTPPHDFRGSSAYRLVMVETLARRVVLALED